jgi:uncharacterized membrane-anchored protein YhcB (DUF1043 family)
VIEWIVIVGLVVGMYIIIYKYEKKMDKIHQMVEENKNRIDENRNKLDEHHERIDNNHQRIDKNHERLDEHNNHISQMWVTIPKKDKDTTK